MEVTNAMALRDGGTICVTVVDGNSEIHVTLEYQLPWDGRMRHVYLSNQWFGRTERLEIGGEREQHFANGIADAARRALGDDRVRDFLLEHVSPGEVDRKWLYVLGFLRNYEKERSP